MEHILSRDITTVSKMIQNKKLSPFELTEYLLKEIEDKNKTYHAYITVDKEQALKDAKEAEQEIMKGNYKCPLHGIPISIKDNIHVRGTRLTNGSIIHSETKSAKNASLVRQLRSHNSIIVGKTNMDEFANDVSGMNKHYGVIKNPVKDNHTVGGSSGGSAVSVASNLAFASIGTDTAGSVRIPASCCGIFGLKPTYNMIPMDGITPLSNSLDHAGIFAKSLEDLATIFQTLAPGKETLENSLLQYPNKLTIGYFSDYSKDDDNTVQQNMKNMLAFYVNEGIKIKNIKTNFLEMLMETHLTLCAVESYFFHQEFLEIHEHLYDKMNSDFFKSGRNIPQSKYFNALQTKEMIEAELQKLFTEIDLIVTPTLSILPPTMDFHKKDWKTTLNNMIKYTYPFNMSGLPALSIPYTETENGLPVGFQLISNKYNEMLLFQFGDWLMNR